MHNHDMQGQLDRTEDVTGSDVLDALLIQHGLHLNAAALEVVAEIVNFAWREGMAGGWQNGWRCGSSEGLSVASDFLKYRAVNSTAH